MTKTYLFQYRYEGSEYVLEMSADSPAEAKARIQAAALCSKYVGILECKIPAAPGVGWFVRAWCAIWNFAKDRKF